MKNNLIYAALLAPLLTGCVNHDTGPTTAPAESVSYAPQQIQFSSEDDLSQCLAFQPIARSFDASGIMHVTIPTRLISGMDQLVDYRFTFFDENHIPVDAPSTWMTKSIPPEVMVYIQGASTTPRAKDFQIDFRRPK